MRPFPSVQRHADGRSTQADGHRAVIFQGTAYLGIPYHPVFQKWLAAGTRRWGAGYGSSRLSPTVPAVYEAAEVALAGWTGQEAALTVSSGTLAATLVADRFARGWRQLVAPGTHPALCLHAPPAPGAPAQWWSRLPALLRGGPARPTVLFCNAVDPLTARPVTFDWLNALPADRPLTLVVDDSHGMGLLGPHGGGIGTVLRPPPQVTLVVVASLNKAPGLAGGVVLGPAPFVAQVRATPRFGGSSPVPPAYLDAFLRAQPLYLAQRQWLATLVERLRAHWPPALPCRHAGPVPVFATDNAALGSYLHARGLWLSQFHYPTAADPLLTRVVLTAAHTQPDVDLLLEALTHFAATRPA